ncbi:hypothetical protein KSP35_19035 [Aquihabitans sp. G128]|uniref:hypothetical protein n=1 Tax=Aquihabitans sp. G128 TaxID=2849779 RepID=UPI001C2409B8|nr:hypothetical protein [Aquihabitans sp. G128]QXC60400.1 hypothetical protein KSP35_19035 [Aquihabitans sp. G128]
MANPVEPAPATDPGPRWLAAALGTVAGLVLVGPGLRRGLLLNLDLAAPPELRVPPGTWGLGPALTQRVPLGTIEAAIGVLLGGPLTVKLLIVATVAVAYAGMERLARPASALARHGVALAYAVGPFAATRLAVGHLNVAWAVATLPWALPTLLRPSRSTRRTFLALLVLGLGGTASAVLGLGVVAVGLAVDGRRRVLAVGWTALLASLPWLVPNVVVLAQGASVVGADPFRTDVPGPAGALRLVAGSGFWIPGLQVGGTGLVAMAAGTALLGLAAFGWRRFDPDLRTPATVVAAAGLLLAVASAAPGLRTGWDALSDGPLGAPLREGQRFLVLWLVVALPLAALGADHLARRASAALAPTVAAVPLALGLALTAPAAFGAQGAFEPRHLPSGWAGAEAQVRAHPGTTLVLPWHLYYTASFADDRNVLNPGPDVLGGDTISSYDPEEGDSGQEQLDTRPAEAERILDGYRKGRPGAARLAALGVRWVFVPLEYDWSVSGKALADDPGLRPVPVGDRVLLYEVRGWAGPLRTPTGGRADVPATFAPFRTVPRSGGTWAFPGTGGWLRGTEGVEVTDLGLLRVPAGSGPLWYWPAVPILLGDLVALAWVARLAGAWIGDLRAARPAPEPTPTATGAGDAPTAPPPEPEPGRTATT